MHLSLFIISCFLSDLQEARFHFPASLGVRWDHYSSSSPQDEGRSEYTSSKCGSERPPGVSSMAFPHCRCRGEVILRNHTVMG